MQSSSEAKVTNEFPIVGIGASAGGLDPIRKLLEHLPIETGMAFVVIQHLASGQESMLPEILSRSTKMKVLQVIDGMKVEKNRVYVITPGTTMTLKNGYLKLVPKGEALKPINDFMFSIASERKAQAIGIVLSGTGNDGTEGLKAIKTEGGITFAQDPETAQYTDMPRNAIAAETLDFILSPEQIAKELASISKHPQLIRSETKTPEQEKVETELKKIIKMLKTSFGVDFTHYRETTINRRITRRMVINKTENIKGYVEYLRKQPSELQVLFDDLLIGVTSFFREPDTFLALKEKVFPELVQNRSPKESIRVWVPGCSTGEEVYSFAIAIQEFMEEKGKTDIQIQIFGTDANGKNIEKARQGIYPKSIEDNVSENRLKRFFTSDNGHYRITKPIRDKCIFAKQDITTDPPFSNIDLIMCRNVLIYFDSYLHERILPIFHYGLKPNGFLVLGESESVGKFQYLFKATTSKGLIYQKKQAQPQPMQYEEAFRSIAAKTSAKQPEKANLMTVLGEKVDQLITAEYGPATLLVNNNLDILVFRGDVAPYLSPESGAASFNVTKIIRKELRSKVQTALYRAKKEKKAFKETVHFKQKGQPKTVNIEIRPIKTAEYDEPFQLVLFTEAVSPDAHIAFQEAEPAISPAEMETLKDRQIRELREDLEATKQSLQTLVEGQEATNEELRSSMEEVQSSNEELQSTNEELETAKEELQSGNEELQTLNEELKNRNQTLGRLNDDLANLQTNIDVAVVIVGCDLKIRRFTASAQGLLKISPADVGQSFTNVNLEVHVADLEKTIIDVITTLTAVNQEVTCAEDILCEMRVRPYLTDEKKIDGAVLTFTNITARKKIEEALRKQASLINLSPDAIIVKKLDDTITFWSQGAQTLYGWTKEEAIGQKSRVLFKTKYPESYPEILNQLTCNKHWSGEKIHQTKSGREIIVDSRWLATCNAQGKVEEILETNVDITERKQLQNKLEEHSKNLEKLVEERTKELKGAERLAAIGATAGMVGHDIRNPLQAITSGIYLAKTDLAPIPESEDKNNVLETLEEIEKNISYINKVVVDLQDFAKPLTPRIEETNLEQIIQTALASLNISENIEVTCSIRKDFPKLQTDPTYVQRIITNLSNNAVQAMPNGGKLTITAFSKNGKVTITVEDTGEGIPEKVKSKIFTPLITTKAKGQGFGLSVVKRFTEAMGGTIKFESEVAKGTKFTVELPLNAK